MGKQYNFYIDSVLEKKFYEYLSANGYKLFRFGSKDIEYLDDYSNIDNPTPKLIYFIYKEEWGELVDKKNERLLREKSPIIEFNHVYVNTRKRCISRGRLYLSTLYKNEMKNFNIISKEYNKLVGWLKKEIDYKNYLFENGEKCLYPISQGIVDLVKEGYHLFA